MKIRKVMLSIAIMATASMLSASEEKGEALFKTNCASCHSLTQPQDKSKMVAPPARGVVFHMSEAFGTEDEIKAHIQDFVINPSAEKAICKSVKRFGVMPSLKGAISEEDLKEVAEWMVENLSMNKAQHMKMEQGKQKGQGQRKGQGKQKGQGKHKGKGGCANG